MVTYIRNEYTHMQQRLFSYNNNTVSWQNKHHSDGVHLSDHGTRIMWQRLKDVIRKTLRLPRLQFTKTSRTNRSYNVNNSIYD